MALLWTNTLKRKGTKIINNRHNRGLRRLMEMLWFLIRGQGSGWLLGRLGISGLSLRGKCHCVCDNLSNSANIIMQWKGLTWSEAKVCMVSLPRKEGKRINLFVHFSCPVYSSAAHSLPPVITRKGMKGEASSCCMSDLSPCKHQKLHFVITYLSIYSILC